MLVLLLDGQETQCEASLLFHLLAAAARKHMSASFLQEATFQPPQRQVFTVKKVDLTWMRSHALTLGSG
jgi:hypothetical protein